MRTSLPALPGIRRALRSRHGDNLDLATGHTRHPKVDNHDVGIDDNSGHGSGCWVDALMY